MPNPKIIAGLILVTVAALLASCYFSRYDPDRDGRMLKKLTVVKLEKQHPGDGYTTDTLKKDWVVNTGFTSIDPFFCNKNFHIPAVMPTNSIFKDGIKDKECKREIKSDTARCYEYDGRDRVTKMQVEVNGETSFHRFEYDTYSRITEMRGNDEKYTMTYDASGNLTGITIDGDASQQQLKFIYSSR